MSNSVSPEPRSFRFGVFEVDLRSGELRRQGTRIRLQDKPFQVLVMLLERPGELVTREEMQQRLWPDTIVEFESNLNAAVKRLRAALDDSASNPRFVETVPRRGYRFVAGPASRVTPLGEGAGAPDPSIAVLPFRDRSPEQNQEYFCDGLTEELTDELTKVENLRVVSRISAFQFKNKVEDVRKIGTELNVGALLEGSLRKTDKKLRIRAQLTSVKDGCHIWSHSYECELQDVFDIQDEITAAIVKTLTHELGWQVTRTTGPELILSKPTLTKDLVAHDLYLRGLYFWNRNDREGVEKSIDCFEKAIERDHDYALAYAALADAYMTLASLKDDATERVRLHEAGQNRLDKYLHMIQENYEQRTSSQVRRFVE